MKYLFLLFLVMGCNLGNEKLFPSFDLKVPTPLPKSSRLLNGFGLRAAVGGQPTETSLLLLLNKLPSQHVTVIDLREESHGFVNGLPIAWELPHTTWTNQGQTVEQIQQDERERLQQLKNQEFVLLNPLTHPLKIAIGHVQTEKELVESMGLRYVRIPITENHSPTAELVDCLVSILLQLPEEEWLFAHCHGGRGRATLFAVIYDILMNHDSFSLEEILQRQMADGGSDFKRTHSLFNPRHAPAMKRLQFFQQFYAYCQDNGPFKSPFSKWIKENFAIN